MTQLEDLRSGLSRGVSFVALVAAGLLVPAGLDRAAAASCPSGADVTLASDCTGWSSWTGGSFTVNPGVTLTDSYPIHVGEGGVVTVGTLTNAGTIAGATGTFPGAVTVYGGSSVSAIVNTLGGSIIGGNAAISNQAGTITTITNNGAMSAAQYGILNEKGTIGSIVNSATGSIIGTSDRAQGIVNNGAMTSIVNDGLIQSTDTTVNTFPGPPESNPVGIVNLGSVTSIANTGTIVSGGTANGMGIVNSGTDSTGNYASIGLLTNTGTIIVDSTSNIRGVEQGYAVGIENTYGTIGTLDNGGTITATGYATVGYTGANAYGIENYRTITTLNNSGTITATIDDGNTDGAAFGLYNRRRGTIGAIDNSGTITSDDYGVFNYGAIGTLTNSGTIAGGQYGVISHYQSGYTGTAATIGAIVNTGTISGGLYGISIDTATTLSNSGTISGGTAAVSLHADGNTVNIYDGARFTGGVQFASTLSNTLNFYTGSYTLAVQDYLVGGNTINLLGTARTVVTGGLNGSGTGDILVIDTSAVGTLRRTADDVQRQVSGVIQDIMDLDMPRPDAALSAPTGGASAYAAAGDRTRNPTAIQVRSRDDQALALDDGGNLYWLRGFYGGRHQDADGAVAASSAHQYGTLTGVDHRVDDWRFGAFAGAGRSNTKLSGSTDKIDADMALAGIYARRSFGLLSIDAALTGGHIWADSTRGVNAGAEIAEGSFGGWFIAPEAAIAAKYALGRDWSLTPSLKARYIATFYDSYTETGSSQNIGYDSHTTQSLEERFDTRLTYQAATANGLAARYWLGAGASATQHISGDGYGAVVSGSDFTIAAVGDDTVYGGSLSLGFDIMVSRQASLFGSVEGTLYSDSSRTGIARGGVKIAF
jgi:hypothetical protein